jgi:hypothetical protein
VEVFLGVAELEPRVQEELEPLELHKFLGLWLATGAVAAAETEAALLQEGMGALVVTVPVVVVVAVALRQVATVATVATVMLALLVGKRMYYEKLRSY